MANGIYNNVRSAVDHIIYNVYHICVLNSLAQLNFFERILFVFNAVTRYALDRVFTFGGCVFDKVDEAESAAKDKIIFSIFPLIMKLGEHNSCLSNKQT